MPRRVQLLVGTARSVVLNTVKLSPGVLRNVNRTPPVSRFVGGLNRVRVGTTLAGSNNSVVGPVSLVLKPPTIRTLPLGSRAAICSRWPLTRGKVGDHLPETGS